MSDYRLDDQVWILAWAKFFFSPCTYEFLDSPTLLTNTRGAFPSSTEAEHNSTLPIQNCPLTIKALMSSSGSGGSPAGVLGDSVTCNSFIPSTSISTSVSDFLRSLMGDLDLPLVTLLVGVLSISGLTLSTTLTFFLGGDPSLWVAPSAWNHTQILKQILN